MFDDRNLFVPPRPDYSIESIHPRIDPTAWDKSEVIISDSDDDDIRFPEQPTQVTDMAHLMAIIDDENDIRDVIEID